MAEITTVEQLLAMTSNGDYELMRDIDCTGQPAIKCIVSDFKGTLNGNGHTISNLCLEDTAVGDAQPMALFHTTRKAKIIDIVFENLSIKINSKCYKPNVAALCVECSNSQISGVKVFAITPTPNGIPLIYDSNDNEIGNCSIFCNGKRSVNIKFN